MASWQTSARGGISGYRMAVLDGNNTLVFRLNRQPLSGLGWSAPKGPSATCMGLALRSLTGRLRSSHRADAHYPVELPVTPAYIGTNP